jgi:2-keto-myo-inositol isomerase
MVAFSNRLQSQDGRVHGRTIAKMRLALNHVTVPSLDWRAVLDLAGSLGCAGVEFRTDLGRPLFEGTAPETVANAAAQAGLSLFGLAQLDRFNDWTAERAATAETLLATARACGAPAVALIPCNDGTGRDPDVRRDALRSALLALAPLLDRHGLLGLVEPLGFESSSLRHKSEAVEMIETLGLGAQFRLVHDTFHHHLAGGGPVFADHTGMVHISGVTDPGLTPAQMTDAHRGLVDADDLLGNIDQILALTGAGYAGPVSMEAFAPEVQALPDPGTALAASFDFIRSRMAAMAA